MPSDYMDALASSGEIMANVGMYFIISVALSMILDYYAGKKIGKRMLGYKMLRVPRFFSLVFVSVISIIVMCMCQLGGLQLKYSTLTYLGLPYFIAWVFMIVNVLRRIKAETKGRNF